jgi:hypothetical protein
MACVAIEYASITMNLIPALSICRLQYVEIISNAGMVIGSSTGRCTLAVVLSTRETAQ